MEDDGGAVGEQSIVEVKLAQTLLIDDVIN